MKTPITSLLVCVSFIGCTTLQSVQNNPGVQAAETAAIAIGGTLATGSPAFAYLAPIAVNGLTALADGSNPIAVTGNAATDAPLIKSAVASAIPNSTGKTAAAAIANAYVNAMAQPSVPKTPAGANAVIGAIASGLTTGATQAKSSSRFPNSPRAYARQERIFAGASKMDRLASENR
jgi:hypothetical protein